MRIFSPGDKVEVIDEDLCGVVAFAKAELVTITTEEGFSFQFPSHSLVLQKDLKIGDTLRITEDIKHPPPSTTDVNRANDEMVVDLHIHEIVDRDSYLLAHEKLHLQLTEAKNKLEQAKKKRVSKIIFIHGVGKGVLKDELHKFLAGRVGLEFYDASYALYGRGATEVKLYRFN